MQDQIWMIKNPINKLHINVHQSLESVTDTDITYTNLQETWYKHYATGDIPSLVHFNFPSTKKIKMAAVCIYKGQY
jgi:hypothetical protein